MKSFILTLSLALAFVAVELARPPAAYPGTKIITSSVSVPVDSFVFFNPCIPEGLGESVELRGAYAADVTATLEDGRVTRMTVKLWPVSVTGTGLVTGAIYRAYPGATVDAVPDAENMGVWILAPVVPKSVWTAVSYSGWVFGQSAGIEGTLEADAEGRVLRFSLTRVVVACR